MTESKGNTAGYAAVNGGKIYYEVTGEGEPLLLVHSMMMNNAMWDDQRAAFTPYFRVVRFDLRGFGQSKMDTPNFSDIEDIRALLEFLKIDKAHIVGLSMGAEIAHNFALAYPNMVKKLILVGSGLDGYDYPEWAMERWNQFITSVRAEDYDTARRLFIEAWVDGPKGPASEPFRSRATAIMSSYSFIHFKPFPQPESESHPVSQPEAQPEESPKSPAERLGELTIPVLIMVGANDQSDVLDIAEILVQGIPNAKKVIVPGAAHIVNMQQPEAFNRAVIEFLK